jgi:hypothetical protein
MCWYTHVFSTPLNIKKMNFLKNKWTKDWHISKFISKVKQMLISLKTINLLSRCDVSNTLSVS